MKRSAGMIVFKDDMVLIEQRNSGKWAFPGGFVKHNEKSLQGALRETKEETGIVAMAESNEPIFMIPDFKFFLGNYVSGELTPQLSEVRNVRFVSAPEAYELLSWSSSREALLAALEIIVRKLESQKII